MSSLGQVLSFVAAFSGPPLTEDDPPAEPAAEPPALWSAPDECPDEAEVLERSRSFGLSGPVPGEATAIVEPDGNGYRLRFVVDPDGPQREVRSSDCDVLADAVALMLALSVDAVSVVEVVRSAQAQADEAREDDEAPVVEEVPLPGPAPLPPTPPAEEESPAPKPRKLPIRFGLRMAAAIGGGPLPGVNAGASIGLAFLGTQPKRGWSWRAEVGWMHWFPRRQEFENVDEITGDLRLTGGYLRAGPEFRWRRLSVPILVGLDLGAWTALVRTVDFPDDQGPTQLWAAGSIGTAITWEPSAPLALWLGPDMVIPFQDYIFVLEGLGVLHDVWPVGVRALGGLEIRFP